MYHFSLLPAMYESVCFPETRNVLQKHLDFSHLIDGK